MDDYTLDRYKMVHDQIEGRGLHDGHLLAAFRTVPRHLFVPREYLQYAYDDCPLPIGYNQTISQPYIVALMTHLLELRGRERVLEIGTGSGYQAAILANLSAEVHTVEIIPQLYETADKLFHELGYENVCCHQADGSLGWPSASPYDGIIVTAAAPRTPLELLNQLAEGGKLVLPVGGGGYQELNIWCKENGECKKMTSIGVAFVLLRGEHGWK